MTVGDRNRDWTFGLSIAFILVLAVALFTEWYFVLAIPLVLAVAYTAFFRPDYLLYFIAFITPFSLNLEELGFGGIAFYLPTELLLFGFMLILVLGAFHKALFPEQIIAHKFSIALWMWLAWMLITALTSVSILVSLKFLVARLWFIIPVFFFGSTLFLDRRRRVPFVASYAAGLLLIVAFTTAKHLVKGFDEDSAHWIMEPFFRDHTQYAAVVAIFVPILLGATFERSYHWIVRTVLGAGTILLVVAITFTYSRAAWLSIVLAMGIWLAARLRISTKVIVGGAVGVVLLVAISFNSIMMELQKNRTDSSEDLIENVESITNISTDASNLERINRWNAVFAMARERPLFGFGPGTYMFEYAPFQRSRDLTVISTNFGDVGNAHSEYLGPLAEMGIPGMLLTIYLVFILFLTSYRTYHRLPPGPTRSMLLYCTLGLVTYFAHGVLNNFLDADKASVPVFGLMAIIVAIDVESRKGLKMSQSV